MRPFDLPSASRAWARDPRAVLAFQRFVRGRVRVMQTSRYETVRLESCSRLLPPERIHHTALLMVVHPGGRCNRRAVQEKSGKRRGLDNIRYNDYPYVVYIDNHCSPAPTVPAEQKPRRTWRFETEETLEREIYLLLQHLSGELIHELATLLRPSGVTPEQYHILRILQDAGSDGTPLRSIGERSPAGDPDVTGLLDRLEQRGLARRTREGTDRRVVTARITSEGRRLLDRLEDPVAALHARQLGPLGDRGLETLRKLLRKAAEVGPV